jgi:endonuclease/exonuclease/phosphatase family metal-dependent hydrolase
MRLSLKAVLAVAALLLAGAQPLDADASARRDLRVEHVAITAATHRSLTVAWRRVPRADSYVVERGTDLRVSGRRVVRYTTHRKVTVDGLRSGALYCLQLRVVDRGRRHARSHKVCQRTVGREGGSSGHVYRVVTYNICSAVCPRWGARRPGAAALVAATHPDVVGLQEASPDSGMAGAVGGMVQAVAKSGKALLYRRHRFRLATPDGKRRTGFLELGPAAHGPGHRYAVWAELVDRASHQHVLFATPHLSPGHSAKADARRRREARTLVQGLARINPRRLPLVVAGDFNSHQGRHPDSPSAVMAGAGLANSYFRAHAWERSRLNSANGFRLDPRVGVAWGYHVDQVWAQPRRTKVLLWRNAAKLVRGRYAKPLPSNHDPVLVVLRVNS